MRDRRNREARERIVRVARLYGPRQVRLEKETLRGVLGVGEVRVRVTVTGVCGSDIHLYTGQLGPDPNRLYPVIPGHECAGVVEEVGPEAIAGDGRPLEVGDRVTIDPAQPCGECAPCRAGWENLCERMRFLGAERVDGCLREEMIVPARRCWPLPDTLSDEEGALLEPLGVALHAVRLAKPAVGDTAAVLGAGPIGLLSLQVLLSAGVERVFVAEPLDWRLDLARNLGAVDLEGSDEDFEQEVRAGTEGRGVDIAIEAAWAGKAVETACRLLKPGGRLVLVGIPARDRLELTHSLARRKGLTLLFCRRMLRTYPRAIALAAARRVNLRCLVSHRFPFQKVGEALDWAARYPSGTIKVMIHHQMSPEESMTQETEKQVEEE